MKILFLDHQGVMRLDPVCWSSGKPELLDFDPEAVCALNYIIGDTGCDIVVSSDWKLWAGLPEMQRFYAGQGIIKAPIGYTPYYAPKSGLLKDLAQARSEEIKSWLADSQCVSAWVAVDDLDMRAYLESFVFVDDIRGLKSDLVANAIIEFLNT